MSTPDFLLHMGALLLTLFFILGIYFFPAVIAFQRRHVNRASIAILNLFLGWTLLGWVIALIWAFSAQQEQAKESKAP